LRRARPRTYMAPPPLAFVRPVLSAVRAPPAARPAPAPRVTSRRLSAQ
jgi:hypothetical protein